MNSKELLKDLKSAMERIESRIDDVTSCLNDAVDEIETIEEEIDEQSSEGLAFEYGTESDVLVDYIGTDMYLVNFTRGREVIELKICESMLNAICSKFNEVKKV